MSPLRRVRKVKESEEPDPGFLGQFATDPCGDSVLLTIKEYARLTEDLAEAELLIARAVELMSPDQVGQWEGVRAWQERESLDGEP